MFLTPGQTSGSLNGAICRLFNPCGLPYPARRHLPLAADRDMTPTLLIVDDEKTTREGLRAALEDRYDVYLAEDAKAAMELLEKDHFDVLLTDFRLPTEDGMKLIARAKSLSKPPICILMTAYGSEELAVEAMKRGADDYIAKGRLQIDELEMRIANALRRQNLEVENVSLHQQLDAKFGLQNLVGESPAMKEVFEVVQQVAPTRATVLLLGESGTGKEMVAKVIHQLSPRAQQPMVTVHCAALAPTLLESELFGHEKGAFTGAYERRIGRFEQAQGGTLFLDEIGEIDASIQIKLLRFLGERTFERVGSNKTLSADLRLIAATNKNLEEQVKAGAFREDLFFRLRVVELRLPPLRERLEDIPLLARAFLREFSQENSKPVSGFTADAVRPADAVPMAGQRARAAHGHRARRGAVPGREDHRARFAAFAARGCEPGAGGEGPEAAAGAQRLDREGSRAGAHHSRPESNRRKPHAGRQEAGHEPAQLSPQAAPTPSRGVLAMPFLQDLLHKLEVGGGMRYLARGPGRAGGRAADRGLQLARVQKHGHAGGDGRGAIGPQYRPGQGLHHAVHPPLQHLPGEEAQPGEAGRAGSRQGRRPGRTPGHASRPGQPAGVSGRAGRR